MTALAGIAALLGILIVATPQLTDQRRIDADDDRDLSGSAYTATKNKLNHAAIDEHVRTHYPWLAPVYLGEAVTMTGDPGFSAWLQADLVNGTGGATYTLRIQNTGTEPFDGSFSEGCAWLEMDDGKRYYPPDVSNFNGWFVPSAVDPDTESKIALTFKFPAHERPASLILCLRLGKIHPTAQWSLNP
ncbi:hypothetical protein [Actinoplanes italicus]|uniref:hypothetical protein n=1 Tax=Actinoplanes italicus TaxID=113567 RepID=UPI000D074F9D|nr:hypothetical protein [Actinoplanes italicus]